MSLVLTQWRFVRGASPASRIENVARRLVAELDDPDSEASQAARRAGLAPAELAGVRVEVAEGEQGAEPILTSIIVGIISAGGARIAESLWTDVLWPRIRRKLGADALGEPVEPPGERG